jgi:hypothetical protein
MKMFLSLLAASVALTPHMAAAAQSAHARMFCQSVRFHEGADNTGFYYLNLTTLPFGVNGEVAPLFGDYSHWSWLEFYDDLFDELFFGTINLDTPAFADVNDDGYDDFFDVSRGVSANSTGVFMFDDEGVLRSAFATWNRAPGSAIGTCTLTLSGWGTFSHTFRIIQYNGTLAYTPGTTSVSGSVNLTNVAEPARFFTGPVVFDKSPSNPTNELTLQSGTWTNEVGQSLPYFDNIFLRETPWTTNYFGYFDFVDGVLNTVADDYTVWILSIDDTNDADSDGIPDFSDTPFVSPPRQPSLSITRSGNNLLLNISGDTNRLHEVQRSTNLLIGVGWVPQTSFTLTNNPQSVLLQIPNSDAAFWRVRAQ